MSNSGEEFCRRDRLSYRQNHQISGAASATDRYNLPLYDSSNVRHLPVYESLSDSKRHHHSSPSPNPSYDVEDSRDRRLPAPYDHHLHSATYDLNNHRLPPLPPSPNHYVLDTEEPFIPPPDCYLSPPAPAPPDRFHNALGTHDRFLLTTSDLYLPPASVDKYQKQISGEPLYERYNLTDKYHAPDSLLERFADHNQRYGSSSNSYAAGPGDPYVRRDLGYHNHYRLLNSGHYHQKSGYSSTLQRFPSSSRSHQYQTLRLQKCCSGSYARDQQPQSRDASPSAQNRMRTSRTSSPVAVLQQGGAVAATIPVDFGGCGGAGSSGRYLSATYSTLPRCNSYGDMQSNPIGTFRRTPSGHENCCYRRRTSSPSSSSASAVAYSLHPINYSTATTTVSASSSVSSLCSQNFQQPALPTLTTSTW